jgi:hypothetical protein
LQALEDHHIPGKNGKNGQDNQDDAGLIRGLRQHKLQLRLLQLRLGKKTKGNIHQ